MEVPDTATVNSWVNLLTPIAIAILIVVQKWDTAKARTEAAIQAEANRQNYQSLLRNHAKFVEIQNAQTDMLSEVYGIFRKGKITVEPPPKPPAPPPPPPVPPETPLEKKMKVLGSAINDLIQETVAEQTKKETT